MSFKPTHHVRQKTVFCYILLYFLLYTLCVELSHFRSRRLYNLHYIINLLHIISKNTKLTQLSKAMPLQHVNLRLACPRVVSSHLYYSTHTHLTYHKRLLFILRYLIVYHSLLVTTSNNYVIDLNYKSHKDFFEFF